MDDSVREELPIHYLGFVTTEYVHEVTKMMIHFKAQPLTEGGLRPSRPNSLLGVYARIRRGGGGGGGFYGDR